MSLVVGFHIFPEWIRGGYIGVDVFFVISGFLISNIILRSLELNKFSYLNFYNRRIRRIFPALILVLVACLVFGWFALTPSDYRALGKNVVAGAAFVSNFQIMSEAGYFDIAAQLKPLLHLWSLGIEEQFYFFWPLIAVALWRLGGAWAWIFGLVILSFFLNLIVTQFRPVAAFYLPVARFWELGVGCALAYFTFQQRGIFPKTARFGSHTGTWLGLTFIAISAIFFDSSSSFPGWRALLPTFGAALIIGANQDRKTARILSNRMLVALGLISYPLYLWHWPILVGGRYLEFDTTNLNVRLGIVLISVIAAWATYRFVEVPFRSAKTPNLVPMIGLCAGMVVIGFAGQLVFDQKGFTIRYPEEVRAISEFTYNMPKESRLGRCLLDDDQSFRFFKEECVDKGSGFLEPSILIWGDSHAAALYPGVKRIRDEGAPFKIIQYTSSACPPVLGMSVEQRPHCKNNNDYVLARIESLKPSVVIMAAFWSHYNGSSERPLIDIAGLRFTIQRVRQLGSRVVVVGNAPVWDAPPIKTAFELWQQSKWLKRTFLHLDRRSIQMDDEIRGNRNLSRRDLCIADQ